MKQITISRDKAITLVANHNNIPLDIAKKYTDSEIKEVLKNKYPKPNNPTTPTQNKENHQRTKALI